MAASQRAFSDDSSWRSNLSPIWRCVCPHSCSQDVGSDPGSKRLRVFRPLQGARRRLCLRRHLPPVTSDKSQAGGTRSCESPIVDSQPPCDHRRLGPLHRGSVRWNPYLKKYILIANQIGGSSMLARFYGESEKPEGPLAKSSKCLTQNVPVPVQRAFWDEQEGELFIS